MGDFYWMISHASSQFGELLWILEVSAKVQILIPLSTEKKNINIYIYIYERIYILRRELSNLLLLLVPEPFLQLLEVLS